jgi:hypothetical protein
MKMLFAAAATAAMLTATAARAADPPKVDIRVAVAPGTPFDDLEAPDRLDLINGIRDGLMAGCNKHLRFLTWTTGDTAAKTHLDATVKPNPNNGDLVLVLVGTLDDVPFNENFATSIELYDAFTAPPVDFPKKVKDAVFKKVTTGINDEVLRANLQNDFLSRIPLSTEPLKIDSARAVTVPLSRNRLRVGPKSKFGIKFSDGTFVTLDVSALDTEDSGQVVGEVTRVKYGGEQDKTWDDRLPRSFGKPPRARDIRITMADYKLSTNPGTQNGMETRSGNAH